MADGKILQEWKQKFSEAIYSRRIKTGYINLTKEPEHLVSFEDSVIASQRKNFSIMTFLKEINAPLE